MITAFVDVCFWVDGRLRLILNRDEEDEMVWEGIQSFEGLFLKK